MINVLFVCLGNICRSPLAEGIFKSNVMNRGLRKFIQCDSAGTSGWHIGEQPDSRSIRIANENGIRLDHGGRKLHPEDFLKFDYIIAMDQANYEDIVSLSHHQPDGKAKIIKMLDYDNNSSGGEIPDPYYGGPDGFQNVFNMLEESTTNFIDHLVAVHHLDNE